MGNLSSEKCPDFSHGCEPGKESDLSKAKLPRQQIYHVKYVIRKQGKSFVSGKIQTNLGKQVIFYFMGNSKLESVWKRPVENSFVLDVKKGSAC
jgi:hypothetical protein